jgi:hypothetical protein
VLAGGQVLFDEAAVQSPVGDDVVEAVHHLAFGHDRQPVQVAELEVAGIQSSQTATMEGGMLGRVGEQGAQPLLLMGR